MRLGKDINMCDLSLSAFQVANLKRNWWIFTAILIAIAGCAQAKDFAYGVKQLNYINARYNITMESYPQHLKQIDLMSSDLKELKKEKLETGQEQLNYLIDYRLLNLEAEKLFIFGKKYGDSGTTKYGFGCKSRPLVIESAALRNSSALKGFEAVNLLREFIDKYPKESNSAGLSYKNALFLNATFYQVSEDARSDSNIITNFCPKNESLESYQRQFRRETNMSDDFINNLTYENAVPIWKNLEGIS